MEPLTSDINVIIYTDLDECKLDIHRCSENAKCSNSEGSYDCNCDDGFIGNGITCLSKYHNIVSETSARATH